MSASQETDKDVSEAQLDAESIASATLGAQHDDLEKATTGRSHDSTAEPAARVVTATDWTGPLDPGNPHNWSLLKRCYHTFAVGAISFAVTAGSSLITPAIPEIAQDFNVSRTAAVGSLSIYVLGLALGPILAAPISESYGRKVVYAITTPIALLFLVGAGFTKSYAGLLVCRFLAGAAGAPPLAVGAGTNADLFPQHVRAVAVCFFIMMPFLGPALGPVIGGFVAQYKGWRWTQWVTIFIGVFAYLFILPTSETYKKIILARRAKKMGIQGPPKPSPTSWKYWKTMLTVTLIRPVHMLVAEPIVFFLSLYNSFTFSVLFGYFAAYPYTFETVYDFNQWQTGLAFLGVLVGVVLAVGSAVLIDRKVYMKKARQAMQEGKVAAAPEHRLYAAMYGSFGVVVGLFWLAWTARRDVHWFSPVLAGIPFAWGNLSIVSQPHAPGRIDCRLTFPPVQFLSAALYLVDVYGPLNGASAMAANGLARYATGAAFPLFTFQMYEGLGIAWATSLLGFVSLALLPIPWIFFKFGPKIRARSAYDTLKA